MMSDTLDELGRMIGEQQRLMDQTYRQGQQKGQGGEQTGRMPLPGQQGEQGEFGGGGESQRGQTPGEGEPGQMGPPNDGMGNAPGQSLADQQQALREELQALADQLVQGGVDAPSPGSFATQRIFV